MKTCMCRFIDGFCIVATIEGREMNRKCRFVAICVLVIGMMLCAETHAETVLVKYRGLVNLDNFSCSYPSSSFVHRICYRGNRQYLVVLLNKTYYHYCRIPKSVVEQWLVADSKGRFYNAYVKGSFDCRLGGIPTDD